MDFTWLGSWFMETTESAETFAAVFKFLLAGIVALFGMWFGYRVVHWPTFADFLISVEGEMAKVSWPNKAEVRSSTIVVLTVFLLLSAMIYAADLVFVFLLKVFRVV
jgi:preprotein translocase subunit SecE